MDTQSEEMGRKRERPMETAQSARRRASEASKAVVSRYRQLRESSSNLAEELKLKRAVARRNEENPGGEPIVAEELTEQERTALVNEEEKRERVAQLERIKRRIEEVLAAERERARASPPLPDPNQEDRSEQDYSEYRRIWDQKWSSQYGSFEDVTPIPCMCFTDNPMPRRTSHPSTVQTFSVKVAEIAGDLQWPLDVFGLIAMRDGLDHNRNIIFSRARDNCQTLTNKDPYLVLTGPVRAVVHEQGSVYIDAVLKVKGGTESEDKDLSLLIRRSNLFEPLASCVRSRNYTSKLSTLELAYAILVSSVEATISVQVVEGSWPDRLRGQFTACTGSASAMKVLLLDFGDEVVPAGCRRLHGGALSPCRFS